MSKTKALLIVSTILVFVGIAIAGAGVALGGTSDLSHFTNNGGIISLGGSSKAEYGTVPVSQSFNKLEVTTTTIDVRIKTGDSCQVVYNVPEDRIPVVTNSHDTLKVSIPKDNSFFNFHFGTGTNNYYIEITLPENDKAYELDINGSTSDVTIDSVEMKGKIQLSTGDIIIKDCSLTSSKISVSTGDIKYTDCFIGKLEEKGSTGNHSFVRCDIDSLDISTSTGDVIFDESEIKDFKVEGSTADVKSYGSDFEEFEAKLSTGDITLTLPGTMDDYDFEIKTSTGDINIGNNSYKKKCEIDERNDKEIKAQTSSGDINISFTN